MQRTRRALVALAVLAAVVACAGGVHAKDDSADDVHIHVAAVAHNPGSGSNRLIDIEHKFDGRHEKFMGKLNTLHTKVAKHIEDAVTMVETEQAVVPTIDDTGSLGGQPKANLTRFNVKPTIDVNFQQDAGAVRPTTAGPRAAPALVQLEDAVIPITDDTGSLGGQPKANLTRFTVKPTIDASFQQDEGAVRPATTGPRGPRVEQVATFLELSTDIDSEFDKLDFASDEAKAMEMVNAVDAMIEQSAHIAPVVDGSGSDSFVPKANLTRFGVKATVDPSLVQDAALAAAAKAALRSNSFLEVASAKKSPAVVIDGTGSVPVGAPSANLTRFTVKPSIDVNFVEDEKNRKFNVKPHVAARPAASLLEVHRSDCSECDKANGKVAHEVVISPAAQANTLDQPLWAEQHRKVNYLLKGKQLSIAERHLAQGRDAVLEAADAHERFHEFADQMNHAPLIPQDTTMLEVSAEQQQQEEESAPESTLQHLRAELEADFPEMATASMMEVASHTQALSAIQNRGPKGNYPGWSSFLESAARPHSARAHSARPHSSRAHSESRADPLMETPKPAVHKKYPPRSATNVKHIYLAEADNAALLKHAAQTGIKKVAVHVYGKADSEADEARRLKATVSRLARDKSSAYEKINKLILRLKKCGATSQDKECLRNLTNKIQDWQAEFTKKPEAAKKH